MIYSQSLGKTEATTMDSKSSTSGGAGQEKFAKAARNQTEAAVGIQKELLETYEQASRAWLARVQSEIELWSDLANKLSASRSVPDALGAYQETVAQRLQMAAEDARRMVSESQDVMGRITRSMTKGWPSGSS
jgi:phasin protein